VLVIGGDAHETTSGRDGGPNHGPGETPGPRSNVLTGGGPATNQGNRTMTCQVGKNSNNGEKPRKRHPSDPLGADTEGKKGKVQAPQGGILKSGGKRTGR